MNLGLFKYYWHSYLLSIQPLLALLPYLLWFTIAYNMVPVEVLSSYGIKSVIAFISMTILGATFSNHQNLMIETSFMVRVKNKDVFYFSKLLVVFAYSFALAFVGVTVPIVLHFARSVALFEPALMISDVVVGFVIILMTSLCGGVFSMLLNKRIIKQNEVILCTLMIWMILSIIRGSLASDYLWFNYIKWLFPPIHELASLTPTMAYFNISEVWGYLLNAVIYIVIFAFAYVKIMKFRKVA